MKPDPNQAPPKKAFRYKRIVFRSPISLSPVNRMPKEEFVDVDGVPHAGGIDVRFDDIVRTIAWGVIKYADREMPAEVAP